MAVDEYLFRSARFSRCPEPAAQLGDHRVDEQPFIPSPRPLATTAPHRGVADRAKIYQSTQRPRAVRRDATAVAPTQVR